MIFTFMPPAMIMSPGFWSALQAPSHLASMVMLLVPSAGIPGTAEPPSRVDETFTV